jgi:hypothetical protein
MGTVLMSSFMGSSSRNQKLKIFAFNLAVSPKFSIGAEL